MIPKESIDSTTENASPPSPGKRLAAARKERNLTQAEIADALNLTEKKIEALELDNYEGFAGRTYVRGYLLSYARYLLVDCHLIEKEFTQFFPAANPALSDVTQVRLGTANRPPALRIALSLLALILISVLAFAGYSIYSGQAEQMALASPLINPPPLTSNAARNAPDSMANRVAQEQQGLIGPLPPDERVTPPAPVTTTSAVDIPPSSEKGASTPGQSATVTAPVELVLEFLQESWADVRAADGSKLLYNLQPAGSVISLSAELPVKLFLGNADGVKIFYNGEPYEYPVRGRIAQFSIDPAAANPGIR